MKRIITVTISFVLMISAYFAVENIDSKAFAKVYPYKVGEFEKSIKLGKTKFYIKGIPGYDPRFVLRMNKLGKVKELDEHVLSPFMTNGKYIYYVKEYSSYNMIIRMSLKSGAKKKIVKFGNGDMFANCSGRYLYVTRDTIKDGIGVTLAYVIDTKTRKMRKIHSNVSKLFYKKGRILISPMHGSAVNQAIYIYKKDGKGKKKIGKAMDAMIKGNSIYLLKIRWTSPMYRVYKCNLNGKKMKAVGKWRNTPPKMFR